ncbi:MAG: glycosyltransferase family 4 protein [Candidatus Eisenbacteria bacterium]|uniref:Glycosyltransferase family 4 protein n=1 Tax=Eiseniibacteriota bacterium TaxID=2212470 RepID=A0A956LZE5_UNCEI|nr:glycosyltransferase family 4 protein [Candidatus Eisenbacteria bacterium]
MRILHLISQTVIGGAESYGHTLACELAKRGHGVRLLANRSNGPLLDRPCPSDLGTFALGRSNRLDPAILRFLVRHLHDFRPHVIHAHNFGPNSWARALGVMHPRLAVVCHVHSGRMVSRHRARRVMLDRVMYRRADAVIALNNEQVTFLEDRLLVPAERIHLMPNGIDMRRFKPPSENTRNPREVVCVASLTPIKHHEGLLQAWGKVRREIPDAKLTLVGDGELRRKLEEQARSLEIQDSIEFTGIRSDVVPFLERAGVFVLPSLREAMPLALLEAMAAGLASVASDVGGIPEMIEDGFNGRLVPAGDTDALAARLIDVLRDPECQVKLGEAARQTVVRRYSLTASVDQIERLYAKLVEMRAARAPQAVAL